MVDIKLVPGPCLLPAGQAGVDSIKMSLEGLPVTGVMSPQALVRKLEMLLCHFSAGAYRCLDCLRAVRKVSNQKGSVELTSCSSWACSDRSSLWEFSCVCPSSCWSSKTFCLISVVLITLPVDRSCCDGPFASVSGPKWSFLSIVQKRM